MTVQAAMHDFIETCVSQDDFTTSILPAMEKALLRSPEYSLSGQTFLKKCITFHLSLMAL